MTHLPLAPRTAAPTFLLALSMTLFAGCDGATTGTASLPLAVDAGPDLSVSARASVQLAVTTGSSAGTLTYTWSQVSGTEILLSDTTSATPTFVAPDAQDTDAG